MTTTIGPVSAILFSAESAGAFATFATGTGLTEAAVGLAVLVDGAITAIFGSGALAFDTADFDTADFDTADFDTADFDGRVLVADFAVLTAGDAAEAGSSNDAGSPFTFPDRPLTTFATTAAPAAESFAELSTVPLATVPLATVPLATVPLSTDPLATVPLATSCRESFACFVRLPDLAGLSAVVASSLVAATATAVSGSSWPDRRDLAPRPDLAGLDGSGCVAASPPADSAPAAPGTDPPAAYASAAGVPRSANSIPRRAESKAVTTHW